MKLILPTIAALSFSSLAAADQFVTMPNGGGCWVSENGIAYGCTPAPQAPAPRPEPANCMQLDAELARIDDIRHRGYSAQQGAMLDDKQRRYEDLRDKYCR